MMCVEAAIVHRLDTGICHKQLLTSANGSQGRIHSPCSGCSRACGSLTVAHEFCQGLVTSLRLVLRLMPDVRAACDMDEATLFSHSYSNVVIGPCKQIWSIVTVMVMVKSQENCSQRLLASKVLLPRQNDGTRAEKRLVLS